MAVNFLSHNYDKTVNGGYPPVDISSKYGNHLEATESPLRNTMKNNSTIYRFNWGQKSMVFRSACALPIGTKTTNW